METRALVDAASQLQVPQTAPHRFPRTKKPAGSVGIKNYRHGLGLGTGPVRVPGRTGSTGNRLNRSGSQRFGEPWPAKLFATFMINPCLPLGCSWPNKNKQSCVWTGL
jgi:hypothetical protein